MYFFIVVIRRFLNFYCLTNFYSNCDMLRGTNDSPICTGNKENDYTKFQSWFDGSAYKFYNEQTSKYICIGSTDDGEKLVAQGSFDSSACLIEITLEEIETQEERTLEEIEIDDFEFFFCEENWC